MDNLPAGSYTLVVNAQDFVPIIQEIDLTEGQALSVTLPKMTLHPKGDVSGDGKIGMEEAIHVLQVISGVTPVD